jgi:hypothetical protein
MGANTKRLLSAAKYEVQSICEALVSELCLSFTQAGFEKSSLDALVAAAARACSTSLNAAFERMNVACTRLQRKLTRSMLPKIMNGMRPSYHAASIVEFGKGKFERMENAMHNTSGRTLSDIFSETLSHMQHEISNAIKAIAKGILDSSTLLREELGSFLNLSWEIDRAKASSVDDGLLHELARLLAVQKEASNLLGVDCEAVDAGVSEQKEPEAQENTTAPSTMIQGQEVSILGVE